MSKTRAYRSLQPLRCLRLANRLCNGIVGPQMQGETTATTYAHRNNNFAQHVDQDKCHAEELQDTDTSTTRMLPYLAQAFNHPCNPSRARDRSWANSPTAFGCPAPRHCPSGVWARSLVSRRPTSNPLTETNTQANPKTNDHPRACSSGIPARWSTSPPRTHFPLASHATPKNVSQLA